MKVNPLNSSHTGDIANETIWMIKHINDSHTDAIAIARLRESRAIQKHINKDIIKGVFPNRFKNIHGTNIFGEEVHHDE